MKDSWSWILFKLTFKFNVNYKLNNQILPKLGYK